MKRIYYKEVGDILDTKVVYTACFEDIDMKNTKMDMRVLVYNIDGIGAERIMYDAEDIANELGFEVLKKKIDWNEHGELRAGAIFRKVQIYSRKDYTRIMDEETRKLLEYFALEDVLEKKVRR